MSEKKCSKCEYYSRSLGRCKLGKINPRTRKGAKDAASFMGWGYICGWNKWKQRKLAEMTSLNAIAETTQG